jgi:DNA-binding MarR family transcriptional regulator
MPASTRPPHGHPRHRARSPTAIIEAQLSPTGEPVLGLYLHVAYLTVMSSFGRRVGRGEITPAIVGMIAMLAARPGVSQAELARLLRLERATIGTTVSRAIALDLVIREDASGDARRYALSLSPRGRRMLRTIRRRITAHERATGARLTAAERRTLRALLHKLVYGGVDGAAGEDLRHL